MDDTIPDGKPRSSSTAKGPDSNLDDLSRLWSTTRGTAISLGGGVR